MHALVIGATGATGKDLVELLLQDVSFEQVDIFVRRSLDIRHDKLKIHVIDFDKPEEWVHLVKGYVLFSCLGTTIKAAGSKGNQWKVDYGYQYEFAKAARENGVERYVLVSADFASPKARSFYSRMKGKLEEAVIELVFPYITIFNPPILERKNSDRVMENLGLKAIQLINKAGILRSQQPLPTEILAQAMINSAQKDDKGLTALKGKAIWERAGANAN
ncbi:NAD(P)H-binding protein [Planococcus sp. ISL-109]|uniref:NAD(P)H-binding protein n=1 Tax=Planococcus sp. ISL-109 TaxID=2819166 RepID=UPI001BE74451|nr:NAD(P)H-binding protein [Planococcus sp. ISL-109]MBT2582249.1 NAD(P)H-binding protein [Planococcus sp. ISL-109]